MVIRGLCHRTVRSWSILLVWEREQESMAS